MKALAGSRLVWAVLLASSSLAACARETPEGRASRQDGELAPVVAPRIAELERAMAPLPGSAAEPPATSSADPELAERVQALALELGSTRGRMRAVFAEELAQVGDEGLPALDGLLADRSLDLERRSSVLEALAAIGTPAASGRLLAALESSPEPASRALAGRLLARADGDLLDHLLPRLLLRLKYEIDGATVVAIAAALAARGSWAGVDGLLVVSAEGASEELRDSAATRLAELAARAGTPNGAELARAWRDGTLEQRLPPRDVTPPLELEIWRLIARLADRDLRVVDDARFVLARLGPLAAPALAEALRDEDIYLRVHAAQCLERMGPRGSRSVPGLVAALADARLAPSAAAALGAIRDPAALEPLLRLVGPDTEPELASAAARALGALGDRRAGPSLRALSASGAPLALRQTAAESLEALGLHDAAVPVLVECLEEPLADGQSAEAALERVLSARAGRSGATDAERELFDRWRELGSIREDAPKRRRARAELVQASSP